jgi:lactoylglutathione lyase
MENCKLDGLAHIGVFVADIEVSKKFYTEILDFKVIEEVDLDDPNGVIKVAFAKNGGLVLELVQFPKTAKKTDGPVDHIAFNVKNIEGVRSLLEKRGLVFEEKEITHAPNVFPGGSKWILFRGPDGEHLELNERLS